LYNSAYELINEPDVDITITNEEGKSFDFLFSKTKKAYTLNAGSFTKGSYQFQAKTSLNNRTYKQYGQFNVAPLQLEQLQTRANHQLLYQIAKNNSGELFYPDQFKSLKDSIRQQENIRPISHIEYTTESFINLKWIFFLLLMFVSAEWFLRKWVGGY